MLTPVLTESRTPIISVIPGLQWPAVADPFGSSLMSLLFQFEQSQWWPAERHHDLQDRQLCLLLAHAYQHTPFWRRRLDEARLRPAADTVVRHWRDLPIVTRADLQAAGADAFSRYVNPAHGQCSDCKTSGSTGRPLTSRATQLCGLIWDAVTLRDHLWHRRDISARLAIIRSLPPDFPKGGVVQESWGKPAYNIYKTGRSALMSVAEDIDVQWRWLRDFDPHYLLTHPTNLRALAQYAAPRGERLENLRHIRSIGEMVSDDVRELCRETFGVELIDVYSAQEVGQIALQCPMCTNYHVQSEIVRVEVLDDRDQPCAPGEVGRIVVTRLHNFAMPLLRYSIQDFAEVGGPCPCGRGLPTLRRILGRQRNLLTLPDGRRVWPLFSPKGYLTAAPVRQLQLIQHAIDDIEARVVTDQPLTEAQTRALNDYLQSRLTVPYPIRITRVDEIPHSAGHKFEDFISRVN